MIDGKVANYFGTDLQFSADGKTLYAMGRDEKSSEQILLIDGKASLRGSTVRLLVPPVGNRWVAVVTQTTPQSGPKHSLVVEGRKADAADVAGYQSNIERVVLSPDGKRYAAVCKASQNVSFVVIDGKKGQHYDGVWQPEQWMGFSPNSSKLGYLAQGTGKYFCVVDENESEAFDAPPEFSFSSDGRRVAWWGQKSGATNLYVDGKLVGQGRNPLFSPDGSRYAFVADRHSEIYLDGKNTGLRGDKFVFSPDSKHFAVIGSQPSVDPKSGVLAQFARALNQGLFVNGLHVWGSFENQNLRFRAFTPDSQHLFWTSEEPATGAKAGPGKVEWVTYLDGKAVTRFDREPNVLGYVYATGNYKVQESQAAWHVGSDGALTFLGPVNDVVKRFTIKPSFATSVATMLVEAAEAPAKAAAAEAEAKRKVEEEAAAKKAKRDAEIAEAAAKRKADYDAALAKRKADQEAALAKRKADQEASAAKRAERLKQQLQK